MVLAGIVVFVSAVVLNVIALELGALPIQHCWRHFRQHDYPLWQWRSFCSEQRICRRCGHLAIRPTERRESS